MVVLYLMAQPLLILLSALVFGIAALSDWLDGYIARRWHQSTAFGAFLDPVADKLLVIAAVVLLVHQNSSLWLTLPGMIIIGREILVSALREWMSEMNRRGLVRVGWLGKWKTTLQMIAIFMLLAAGPLGWSWWNLLAHGLFLLAALLTLWSMIGYLQAAWPTLREHQ